MQGFVMAIDVEFEGTTVLRARGRPVLVEAGYSEHADFELFGGEGVEVGGGEAGDALFDDVAPVCVEPHPFLFRDGLEALVRLSQSHEQRTAEPEHSNKNRTNHVAERETKVSRGKFKNVPPVNKWYGEVRSPCGVRECH